MIIYFLNVNLRNDFFKVLWTMKIKLKNDAGNVLFMILIAVALFAALSYAVTKTTRGGGSVEREEKTLKASRLVLMGAALQSTVTRMVLAGGGINSVDLHTGDNVTVCTVGLDCAFSKDGGSAFVPVPMTELFTAAPVVKYYEIADGWTVSGMGSAGADIIMTMSPLTGVGCEEINRGLKLTVPPPEDSNDADTDIDAFPGSPFGCYDATTGAGTSYTYYHVLAAN